MAPAKGCKMEYRGFTPWNDQTIEILRKYWESGETASEIAVRLAAIGCQVTRNAVIGKAHRMNFKQPPRELSPKAPRQKPRKRIVVPATEPRVWSKPKTRLPTQVKTQILDPNNPGIDIMDLDRTKCTAIVKDGTPNRLARYCGVKVEEGKSFCPAHCALYYQPLQPRSHHHKRY